MAPLSTSIPLLALKCRTNVRKAFMIGWGKAGDTLLKRYGNELAQSQNNLAAALCYPSGKLPGWQQSEALCL